MKKFFSIIIFLAIASVSFAQIAGNVNYKTDGPYIIHSEAGTEIIRADSDGVTKEFLEPAAPFIVESQDGKHRFEVKLHEIERPRWKYEMPDRILVLSDPHGSLNALVNILQAQNVIDEDYNWSFGTGHLVIIGDIFDRGDEVLPIYWLVYILEDKARSQGGDVHFLLRNHEEMVLRNDIRYVTSKYNGIAEALDMQYDQLFDENTELRRWIRTRNTIEIIGDNLFVHAGLSKEFLDRDWEIPSVNDTVSFYLGMDRRTWNSRSENAKFLYGSNGPLWYRGMVSDNKDYNPIDPADVELILEKYGLQRIFVGHTIFEEVLSRFGGRVIDVNVDNCINMDHARSRGALVEKDRVYRIYDDPALRQPIELVR